jgi:hypothetical protein
MEKARIKVGGTATTKEEMAERNAQGIAEEEARQAELQRVSAKPTTIQASQTKRVSSGIHALRVIQ